MMKTISTPIHKSQKLLPISAKTLAPALTVFARNILVMSGVGTAAIAIITLSVWAAGPDTALYLGAVSWSLGFVFLALAVDSRGPVAKYQMMTGLAMLLLAVLQRSVSPDFGVVAGFLAAVWIVVLLFKRLSH
jgi:hypothetical protein